MRGCYVVKKQKRNTTTFVKNSYFTNLRMEVGDQDKKWVPLVCKTYAEKLRERLKGICSSMPFDIFSFDVTHKLIKTIAVFYV